MTANLFIKGIILGFSIAAPVGPIGILCIKRSLIKGKLSGFVTGLGAAAADAIYGIIASFSLTVISSFLVKQQSWLQAIGVIFLVYLGIKTFIEIPGGRELNTNESAGLFKDFIESFFLMITNPITILAFAVVFAGLGLSKSGGDYFSAVQLVSGVFIGSASWWWLLSSLASLFKGKTGGNSLVWINRISGIVIICFAAVLFISFIKAL